MRILVACEFTGTVRDSFIRLGKDHDVWSCDLLASETAGPHLQCDVRDVLGDGWDMMIAHPPCTHLAVSGAAHFREKIRDGRQAAAVALFREIALAPIPRKCIENPVSIMSDPVHFMPPMQVIQPYQFGHGEKKRTCLWLFGLPKLVHTHIVDGRSERIRNMSYHRDRAKNRSRTYPGIAAAMAAQWG